MANIYDKTGREIMVGDILKVFHFTAALRREKRYMFKQVVSDDVFSDGTPFLRVSHLDLKDDTYTLICDGKHLKHYEIIQSVGSCFRDRTRHSVQVQSAVEPDGITISEPHQALEAA